MKSGELKTLLDLSIQGKKGIINIKRNLIWPHFEILNENYTICKNSFNNINGTRGLREKLEKHFHLIYLPDATYESINQIEEKKKNLLEKDL